ncbi:MAG: mechanosensitive ion channel, partial [Chloroflexi bacterium]|nr:mechanosensitive ion channel [Chloroflexota bacterium]
MPNDGVGFEVFVQQIELLRIYWERPDVQWQLLVLLLVIGGAYLVSELLSRATASVTGQFVAEQSSRVQNQIMERWLPALDQLFFPITGVVFINAAAPSFIDSGRTIGLLDAAQVFFGLLLTYQILVTLLYAIFSVKVIRTYHRYLLNPLFVLLALGAFLLSVFNLEQIGEIRLLLLYETPITLGNLVSSVLILYVFVIASWVVRDMLRFLVLPRVNADQGLANSIQTITRYIVLLLGILASLGTLGFDTTTLAAIGAGLSVGIGLGLQKVASNFFSGLVLLFEQSVRPGDMIEFGGKSGIVQDLNIRATTLRMWDNVEMIIPNESLVTSTVVTFNTKTDPKRMTFNIDVAYDSDPETVRTVLMDAVKRHEQVVEDPAPGVFFMAYGDSALRFTVFAWVAHISVRFGVESEMRYILWDALRAHGIEIPFPQRDIHIRMSGAGQP